MDLNNRSPHKYAIMDFMDGSTNPVAITGSHNWSASAESINDKNILIIYNADIANQFHHEFYQRFNDLLTPVAVDDDTVTQENASVDIDYLENDFIPEDVAVSGEIVQMPNHGQAGIDEENIFYVPLAGFIGNDSLSFRIYNVDNTDLSDTAWVRIEVG